jgi:hypothetical protein
MSGGVAQAATYYVSKSGSNNNSCAQATSVSTPKLTINAGIGCLSGGGDTLLIRKGTYDETIVHSEWMVFRRVVVINKARDCGYPARRFWLIPATAPMASS